MVQEPTGDSTPPRADDDERYAAARKRVKDVKDFYVHLLVYICVNIALFLINLLSSPGVWWFYWPLLGWGIGLAIHFLSVFVFEGRWFGPDWERRQIDKILATESGSPATAPDGATGSETRGPT